MYPPVLSFASMLAEFMQRIADNTIGAALRIALWAIVAVYKKLILGVIFETLYFLWIGMLSFIWLLEQIFDIFAGTTGVYVNGVLTGSSGNIMENQNFLEALFTNSYVQRAYFYLMIGAFVLSFLFTIFAVIRSMGDSLGQLKRPVSAVLRSAMQASLTFLLVPMACLLLIKVAGAITGIVIRLGENPDMRLSDCLYVLGCSDNFYSDFARKYYSTGRNFMRIDAITYVNHETINYLVAYIATIFMIIVLCGLILQAVMRIITLLALFIVSPYFVATIPLDDGEKFQKWTKLFVGFSMSSFGPMFIMRVYTVIVPMIGPGGSISFGDGINTVTGWILRMVLAVGGCYAAWKSQYIIIDIISPETTHLLERSNVMMAAAKQIGNAAANAATGGASSIAEAIGGEVSDGSEDSKGGGK